MVVKQSTLSIVAGAIFLVFAGLLGAGVYRINDSIDQQQRAVDRQVESRQLGVDLANAASLLSDAARKFVLTADPAYFDALLARGQRDQDPPAGRRTSGRSLTHPRKSWTC